MVRSRSAVLGTLVVFAAMVLPFLVADETVNCVATNVAWTSATTYASVSVRLNSGDRLHGPASAFCGACVSMSARHNPRVGRLRAELAFGGARASLVSLHSLLLVFLI